MGVWSNIGGALKKVAGVAAPIVGGALGGPAGAAAGAALGSVINGGGVKGAITGAVTSGVGAKLPNVKMPAGLTGVDLIKANAAQTYGTAGQGGGLLDKIKGALGTVVGGLGKATGAQPGTNDTARTIAGIAGSGLSALQNQRQFDATSKQRQQQIDDQILSSQQERALAAQKLKEAQYEQGRVQRQDKQYGGSRDQIVKALMSRLGVGAGGLA